MKRFIKLLLFLVLSLVILLVLVSLLLPSVARVERGDTIAARPAVVFAQLNNLDTYVNWNPWFRSADGWKTALSHPASGDGAYFTWQNLQKPEAHGEYLITDSHPDSLLAFRLTLGKLPPMEGQFELTPAEGGKATRVRWTVTMHAGWKPWWRFWAATMNRLMEPAMTEGLGRLRRNIE